MHYQKVTARHGLAWFSEGWRLFLRRPLLFIAMSLAIFISALLLSRVPVLGAAAALLLVPVLSAGVYAAVDRVSAGEQPDFDLLFHGFREQSQPLFLLGLLLLGAQIVTALLVLGLGGVSRAGPGGMAVNLSGLPWLMLMVMMALVMMAYTFAVPLVGLAHRATLAAVKMSFLAVAANWTAFLVYGLVYTGLAILASLTLGLGWIILFPLTFVTVYLAYRDIFTLPGHAKAPSAEPFSDIR